MLSGTKEAGTAEGAAAGVPEVRTDQDVMICKENTDENQEPLLERSPSPSLLHSGLSPLVQVGSGEPAVSGKLLHDQSHDQRRTDTMARKRPPSGGDSISTDSGSTTMLEMSPTSAHLSPSALNL